MTLSLSELEDDLIAGLSVSGLSIVRYRQSEEPVMCVLALADNENFNQYVNSGDYILKYSLNLRVFYRSDKDGEIYREKRDLVLNSCLEYFKDNRKGAIDFLSEDFTDYARVFVLSFSIPYQMEE